MYYYRVEAFLRGAWREAALFVRFRDAEDWADSRLRPVGPWGAYRIRDFKQRIAVMKYAPDYDPDDEGPEPEGD